MRGTTRSRRATTSLLAAVIGVVSLSATMISVAGASVSTDRDIYYQGETVQISGDGMDALENVMVDVTFPDGTLAQEDTVTAGENGNFVDTYVIPADAPGGIYTVTATGQTSGIVFTTTFDPPAATTTTLSVTPGHSTGNTGEVYYGDTLSFAGTVQKTSDSSNVSTGDLDVKQSKERKSDICATANLGGPNTAIFSSSISAGAYDSGAFAPGLSAFPATSFASGKYYVSNYDGPPTSAYASAVGTYAFKSFYSGGTPTYASSESGCEQVDVVKAPTTSTSQFADGTGTLLTQIGTGVPFYLEWGVGSVYGITGNTAAGSVAVTQSNSGLGCPTTANSFTATETTGSGFSYAANSSSNSSNRFTCTSTTPGNYTAYISFTDNAASAATNPDGNYGDSNNSPGSGIQVVAVQIQVCPAAPAIAAAELKAKNVRINSPKYDNIVQKIADEMAKLTRAQFPTYTYSKPTLSSPGAILRPCDAGYANAVKAKTDYWIDQR